MLQPFLREREDVPVCAPPTTTPAVDHAGTYWGHGQSEPRDRESRVGHRAALIREADAAVAAEEPSLVRREGRLVQKDGNEQHCIVRELYTHTRADIRQAFNEQTYFQILYMNSQPHRQTDYCMHAHMHTHSTKRYWERQTDRQRPKKATDLHLSWFCISQCFQKWDSPWDEGKWARLFIKANKWKWNLLKWHLKRESSVIVWTTVNTSRLE